MGKKSLPTSDIAPSEQHGTPPVPAGDNDLVEVPVRCPLAPLVNQLENMSIIKNDAGEDVDFVGETKRQFIYFFDHGYVAILSVQLSIYSAGAFLNEVRATLKPKKLFLTWLHYAGFPVSTAYNYVKLYNSYQEDLRLYCDLGVRKLLAVAKLRDCRTYVKENEAEIASKPSPEVIEKIKEQLKKEKKRKGGGRKRQYEEFGKYRIRRSGKGTSNKVIIENLTKHEQEKIIDDIKLLLSKDEKHFVARFPPF
ncbi:MAG: hypothetical protein ACLQPD_18260 [Desulfomonilaceae bacterium]